MTRRITAIRSTPRVVVLLAALLGMIGGWVGLGLAGAAPAGATSCAGDASISRSMTNGDVVFVGTAVSTTNRGTWVTFAVEEVWSGDPAPTQVVKAGLPPQGNGNRFSGMAGEHTFEPGDRYLVDASRPGSSSVEAVFADDDHPFEAGDLVDGPCSGTTEWSEAHAADRPPTARVVDQPDPIEIIGELPDPRPDDGRLLGVSRPWQLGLGIGLVLVAGGLATIWWRGRREVSAPVP